MIKNICFLISNLEGGGAQRVVSTLTKGLSSSYRVHLILHDAKKIGYPYRGELFDLETPVVKPVVGKAAVFVKRILKLRKIKKSVRPLAVISFLESSNFINLLAGKCGKTIISVRNYKSKQGRSFLGRLFHVFIKGLYNRSDLIVVPSGGIKADLMDSFGLENSKIKVIYNPYDLKYIAEKAGETLIDQEEAVYESPFLITAGSLTRQKGQWHLIRAFKEIKKAVPGLKLVVLGEGTLRAYLEELAADLGLKDDIYLAGFKSNPFQLISRASVFVLPSLFEGFPNALVEAMACGVPVVAADCPSGPREILDPEGERLVAFGQVGAVQWAEFGALFPVCSGQYYGAEAALSVEEKALAEAVVKLLADKNLSEQYRVKSLQRAADFAIERIVKQWEDVIET